MSSHVRPSKSKKREKTQWLGITKALIPSLPDDLLVSCLARVSRLYYPTLSLVSKRFQSLLASPELYEARSLLGRTESCLYICLLSPYDQNPCWFTFYRKPHKPVTKDETLEYYLPHNDVTKDETLEYYLSRRKPSGNILVPISSPNYPCVQSSNLVSVGPKIYGFGREGWSSSSRVSVLDCRNHTWHKAPSMRAKRSCSSTASVVDGKIYVAGGNSLECVEVFDPETQTWDSIPNPPDIEKYHGVELISFGIEGKFYLFKNNDTYDFWIYSPKESKWDHMTNYISIASLSGHSYCVIDNVLFRWNLGDFEWYDCKEGHWKEVRGLKKGLIDFNSHGFCKMMGYGGKLVALWDVSCFVDTELGNQTNMIWCAEIALERRFGEYISGEYDIFGKVEWLDILLSAHESCDLLKGSSLISVTI